MGSWMRTIESRVVLVKKLCHSLLAVDLSEALVKILHISSRLQIDRDLLSTRMYPNASDYDNSSLKGWLSHDLCYPLVLIFKPNIVLVNCQVNQEAISIHYYKYT